MAAAKVGSKWGFVDKTGNVVIAPQFDEALDFGYGLARVRISTQWAYIDESGKFVWGPANW